jgi:hypothetical protein
LIVIPSLIGSGQVPILRPLFLFVNKVLALDGFGGENSGVFLRAGSVRIEVRDLWSFVLGVIVLPDIVELFQCFICLFAFPEGLRGIWQGSTIPESV